MLYLRKDTLEKVEGVGAYPGEFNIKMKHLSLMPNLLVINGYHICGPDASISATRVK